eukprot:Sspe_Gene.118981::Locus_113664_Transcript_1_1_Confidence_1.000_Length_1558::g.118981::m.118981
MPLRKEDVQREKERVWQTRVADVAGDATRLEEHRAGRVVAKGGTMRFHMSKIGADGPGLPLYIALHGGGGCPAHVNDNQWEHMKVYYAGNVKRGVYCAPRGMEDVWNQHFLPCTYPCYARLIENMVVYEWVDPNRVYFLGFSAGGDGVYQIACRIPDWMAAAAMSAGHPNGVSPVNLLNAPLLVQVGEGDCAYDRNCVAVEFGKKLASLGYTHCTCYVHMGKDHNFNDNDPCESLQCVEPVADSVGPAEMVNTSSVRWVSQHVRTTHPKCVVWERATAAPISENRMYWLDTHRLAVNNKCLVRGRLDQERNAVVLEEMGGEVRVLLDDLMLDLDRPVRFTVDGVTKECMVTRSVRALEQSLADRVAAGGGDPCYLFPASVVVSRTASDSFTVRDEYGE